MEIYTEETLSFDEIKCLVEKRREELRGWPEWKRKGFSTMEEWKDWVTMQGLNCYLRNNHIQFLRKKEE